MFYLHQSCLTVEKHNNIFMIHIVQFHLAHKKVSISNSVLRSEGKETLQPTSTQCLTID